MSFFDIKAIAQRLETQDNACTAHPVFVVEERDRITGIDTQWVDAPSAVASALASGCDVAVPKEGIAWIDDEGEVDPSDPDWAKAEAHYQETNEEPWGWTRTGYVDRWHFVVACFTREAAERYIEENRHNLRDPRVWVASAHRNKEWQIAAASFKVMARAMARLERFVGERSELPLNLFGMIDTLVRRAEHYAQEVRRGP